MPEGDEQSSSPHHGHPKFSTVAGPIRWPGPHCHAIALPKGTLSALVERAACDAIQNCLARHKAEATRNNKTPENALLRNGYARCVYCGLVMHVQIRTRQAPVSMCGGA